jgi:hypothetical protein
LGTTLNAFLPSSITTTTLDGGGVAITGTKTPETGLNQTWLDTTSTFASWYAAQTATDVRWTVAAGDAQGTAGATNVQRALVAFSQTPTATPSNAGVRLAVGSSNGVSGVSSITMAYDTTGATVLPSFLTNNGFGTETLSLVGSTSALWYYRTTAGTLANSALAIGTQFGNSLYAATISLASNGTLTYDLAPVGGLPLPGVPETPLPASVWMMGAGLAGMGAFLRRRAAATKA